MAGYISDETELDNIPDETIPVKNRFSVLMVDAMELENSPDAEDSVKDNFSVKLGEASDHIPKSKIVDTSKEQMSAKSAPVNNPKGRHLLGESRDLKKYTEDPLAGQPSFFSGQFLPSIGDVYNHFRELKRMNDKRGEDGKFKKSVYDAMKETAEDVEKVWAKGPYPHISTRGIIKKIDAIHTRNRNLHKNIGRVGQQFRDKEDKERKYYKNV